MTLPGVLSSQRLQTSEQIKEDNGEKKEETLFNFLGIHFGMTKITAKNSKTMYLGQHVHEITCNFQHQKNWFFNFNIFLTDLYVQEHMPTIIQN